MIIVKLQGGLGNQLFQWAVGKSLSIDLATKVYFDLSFLKKNIAGITKRDLELNKFYKIQAEIQDLNSKIDKLYLIDDQTPYNIETNHDYYLDGYFQKEKYFINNEQVIRSYLVPTENQYRELKNNYLDIILNSISVSMHIRRTDYVSSKGYHPVLDIDYYQRALSYIPNYENLFVFSDDIEWCKNNLSFKNMIFVANNDNIIDLFLMSMCKHNIIANSSFSWWASWMNNNKDKIVVLPKIWNQNTSGNDYIYKNCYII